MSGTDLAEPAKTFELTITTMDFVRRDVIAPGDMLLKDVLQEFAEAMSRPGLAADGEMIVRHL